MSKNIKITFNVDESVNVLLKELIREDGRQNCQSKIIRNAIRTYYNYLQYRKKTSMGERTYYNYFQYRKKTSMGEKQCVD